MLSVELVSLSATLGSTAICTLPVEMKHCIAPVIEPIVDLLHVAPLLFGHKLAVLVFVPNYRPLDVSARLALTAWLTGVALPVKLTHWFQLVTAATLPQLRCVRKPNLIQLQLHSLPPRP